MRNDLISFATVAIFAGLLVANDPPPPPQPRDLQHRPSARCLIRRGGRGCVGTRASTHRVGGSGVSDEQAADGAPKMPNAK
jgi:hypothetical protein